ncbi:LytR/AlgR family response regulator transcription factor [Adhaeribacter radiodurans]|uniref:Response regulator transcription factor n=1 Tax=Adhaeribacter radiodurans TaxID=2745197 RepID=A0A7L7L8X8_9BACT|nr:LytTR family DNA-binding domain-containing protein [Adhaeribacter radiodurans]QMU29286.1 response regulator transcription factor [Adhaeribacter radiodurans]
MVRAIIIDDEIDAREALKLALNKYCPDVTVLRCCETPQLGLKAIETLEPDLVFLDVQMPGMSGFDLLQRIKKVNFVVIFVTAFDRYAIKAIKFSALDYLLKPVDVDDLIQAIQKVKEQAATSRPAYHYQSALNNSQHAGGKIQKIAVPTHDGIDFFLTDDIIYCEADGSYTTLILKNKSKQIVCKKLIDFENLLTESGFCRVHHSFLINMKHILKYIKGEGGYVILTDNHHVDISRRKKEEFLQLLDRL